MERSSIFSQWRSLPFCPQTYGTFGQEEFLYAGGAAGCTGQGIIDSGLDAFGVASALWDGVRFDF